MHMTKIRWVAASLAILLPPTACGSDDEPAAQADTAADTRTVEHAMGSTDVPAEPERLVVLDSSFLDAALALGVTPVGATEASAGEGMPSYLAEEVPDIEVVGLTDEPSLEAIAALRPDLILGAKVRHEELYDELAEIAPTVFSESSGTNWKDGVAVTAEALGAEDEADELLEAYQARAEEVGEAVGAEGKQLSMVRFLLPDEIRLYGPDTFSGSVLTDVGFDLGERDWDEYSMAYISPEQVGLADADVVFSSSYGGTETPEFKTAFGPVEPLWAAVPAVAEGRQHWVEDDIWMLGIGPTGAGLILDDTETMLAG
jgi:iron complex transport system substrate-binding protein